MSTPSALPGTPKRVLLLVYDTFAEFEVSVLITALTGTPHMLTTFGLTGGAVTSTGGLRVVPDKAIADVDPGEFDALVVPGGEASRLQLGRPELQRLVTALDRSGAAHVLPRAVTRLSPARAVRQEPSVRPTERTWTRPIDGRRAV